MDLQNRNRLENVQNKQIKAKMKIITVKKVKCENSQ